MEPLGDVDLISDMYEEAEEGEDGGDIEEGLYGDDDDDMMSLLVPSVDGDNVGQSNANGGAGSQCIVRPPDYPRRERVKMIHLRSYLEKVHRRVEAKQQVVDKFKEQLKTCRQNIERLEAEEADTRVGIESEMKAGRRAAVFRLRAQLTRVELEREGECGLRDHIESNLEDAQYDLTLAQIEQGKYLVAEAQLVEKEDEFREHQQKLAEFRQNKERHYTRLAEKELMKREEQLQQARELMQQQERVNKQRMKDAHERHNRFLKETLQQIRDEKSREEQEYRDDLERKIKSVLNLKQDISKNRENLTALQAKDRAMNKAARHREDFLQSSVASEGGNADLALLRERRVQEHVMKREMFAVQQRQNEVEIAAKILMEEERMKKRQQQMPYLFDGPHASKANRVKRHRRRKLQIEKEAERQVDLLERSEVEAQPSLILDPDREYSDLDSPVEDDEDGAQTDSIDRYAERLLREEQERPSDTLAEPEFEGLWDKHKAYSVPTESKVAANGKLAGLSKMEQDIMGRVLDQTRANIVGKQVAAGREFSGQAFYSKPDVIHFKDFEVGRTYKKRIVLTNVSYTVNYCKLVGLTELLKDFIELSFDPPGQLSAGMTCDLHVTFSPKINEDLTGEVSFLAQTGPFSIPLRCTTKKCDLSLDRTLVDFGTTVIGETLKRTFVLRNRGAKGTTFELSRVRLDRRPTGAESSTPTATVEEEEADGLQPEGEGKEEESDESGRTATEEAQQEEDGAAAAAAEDGETQAPADEGEPETAAEEEMSAGPEEAMEEQEEEEYGMRVIGTASGEIGPFSEVRLELCWEPELPDDLVRTDFRIQFADPASEELSVSAVGVAVDVPVWVERQTVDLRLCMLDRLYQDTVIVCNRASTALRLKFEVCPALRAYMELLPKTGYIQAHSNFSAQLKFMPRASLMEDLQSSDLFDPDTGLLEVPMTIRVADQTRPVEFVVQAVVTPTDIIFDRSQLDFGFCTIHEAAVMPLRIRNTSILPQKFGFVGLPDFVEVQPNDGFGTLLPQETVELDVIFSPAKAKDYKFELVCKSLIGRTFSVPCCGVGVHPPLHLSQQVVHFPATTLDDVNTAHINVVNAHTSMNQYSHPVPRIGSKGDIAPVGPTSFEFRVPPDAPISISPCVGTVIAGKRCRVEVRFKPVLADPEVREEACRLMRVKLEAEAMAEYQRQLEEERLAAEEAEKTAAKGGKKKSAPSKKGKTPPSKSGGRRDEEAPLDGPRPVSVPPPESLDADGDEVATGKVSLTRQYPGDFCSFQIPCYVASGKCATGCERGPSSLGANTLYLEVHCPSVRPELVVLSGNGRQRVGYGSVSVGTTVNKSVTLQNISPRPLGLRASCLDPNGPFLMVNALRTLEPGGSHTLLLAFAPTKEQRYREQLVIDAGNSRLRLVISGEGVHPSLQVRQTDSCVGDAAVGGGDLHQMDLGAVIAGEYIERNFTLENTSSLAIDFAVSLDSVSLLRHQEAQQVPAFVRRHRIDGGMSGRIGGHSNALVGLQNLNGQSVFDCVPSAGTIPAGESLEVTVTFAPDNPGDYFSDAARIILFNHEQSHLVQLRGQAKPHIMFIEGGDTLGPDVGSLAAIAPPPTDEDVDPAGKATAVPSSAILLTFGAKMDEEGQIESATRSASVGCVRTMAVSQKKNGEFTFDNPQPLAALGFSIDPLKGQVEAGVRKRVKFTWTPPAGHDPNKPVEGSISVTLRGDVVEQFKVILRAMVVSDHGVIVNDVEE